MSFIRKWRYFYRVNVKWLKEWKRYTLQKIIYLFYIFQGILFLQHQKIIQICENYINDQKNGHTVTKSIKGDLFFEGNYKQDEKNGQGKLIIQDKLQYTGQFLNDKFNGQGILIDSDQNIYEGEFQENQKNGMGKYKTQISNYVGNFKNDKYEGKGQTVFLKNNDFYCGDFKNGKMHGQGEYQSKNFIYNGEFISDLFNGQGTYQNLENKIIYQGTFSNNCLDSSQETIIKYQNGDVYKGFVKNWNKHGKGIMCFANGNIAEGDFVDDLFQDSQQ
ncbi:MORN repeat protein [Ichthyophthirius multifiliis]|uniref:MORN repeat protein n=1 Tax=Ichthyophthirius multifiliis TaxID=5932 RepID=G0QVF1_ICHMU|nr:MORN repeat protein [Ichthyophthirius multifiliis]EGR30808.1 MORN repeat protein [Ichthyophthirius multifiliis]|eukprot:XP_004032395.1 MORN repeat protein [Ichthyophthirius multifiliis]